VAGSWLLGLNAGGFLILGGAGGGAVNAVRYGATSETGGGGGGTTEREIRHGVLTEASGLATIQPRVLSGGLWANDGSTLTDAGLAVQVDGSAIAAKPTANVLYFDDPEGSGVYAYFPLQYADKVSSTY